MFTHQNHFKLQNTNSSKFFLQGLFLNKEEIIFLY